MATDAALLELRTLYPKYSDIGLDMMQIYFACILIAFDDRAQGNYKNCTRGNLELVDHYGNAGDSDMIFHCDDPWVKMLEEIYLPTIKQLEWRFYRLDDFVKFHLPFVQQFPDTKCVFDFDGPSDDPDFFGQHKECRLIRGLNRGCDICELLHFLDGHCIRWGGLGADLEGEILDRAEMWEDPVVFDYTFPAVKVTVKARWSFERDVVAGLVVAGKLGKLRWDRFEAICATGARDRERSDDGMENKGEVQKYLNSVFANEKCNGAAARATQSVEHAEDKELSLEALDRKHMAYLQRLATKPKPSIPIRRDSAIELDDESRGAPGLFGVLAQFGQVRI